MPSSKSESIDYVTLSVHGRNQSENRVARQYFYDFVSIMETRLGIKPSLRYLRVFQSYGQEASYCRFSSYESSEDSQTSDLVRIQNGGEFSVKAQCFVGAPCIRLPNKAYRTFFEFLKKILFETIPSNSIYLSRIDLKFEKVTTTFSRKSLKL